jgi:hypothetical protein
MQREATAENQALRLALVAPFVITAATALVLVAASVAASGVADSVGYPSWAPTAGGMLFAVPTFFAALFFGWRTWLATRHPFRLHLLRLLVGLAAIVGAIVLTLSYVVLVDDPDSYRGRFDPVTQEWEPNFTLNSFLWASVLIATTFPMGGVWFLARYAYLAGIEPRGLDTPEGPDPVGQILQDSRR